MKDSSHLSGYIRSFFEDYLVCRRNFAACTLRSYRDVIKLFVRFVAQKSKKPPAHLLVTDVDETTVLSFLAYLETERGNVIQTRNHRLALVKRFFGYVSLQNPLLIEHCRQILNIPSKRGACTPETTYLDRSEMHAILDVTDTETRAGRRDYTILLFLYNTGARVQEAADLRLGRISFTKPGKVAILGKGNKWRNCPLWAHSCDALQGLVKELKGPLKEDDHIFLNRFGNPISRFGIANIITKYKEIASETVPTLKDKNVTPHTLRHTTAMHLLQSGVDITVIQHWLGHADLSTTQRYVEIDLEMKRRAMKTCEIGERKSKPTWQSSPDILQWLDSL